MGLIGSLGSGAARLLGEWFAHLRLGFLHLIRRPALSMTAVVTLALGVAGVTVTFSLAYESLVRPVALPGFDRVVQIGGKNGDSRTAVVSPLEYGSWRQAPGLLESLTAVLPTGAVAMIDGLPQRVGVLQAGTDFAPTLALETVRGRMFEANDLDEQDTVVLSHGFWQAAFAGRESALGSSLEINGRAHRVLGVVAPAFEAVFEDVDVLLPLPMRAEQLQERASYLFVLGRMNDGATLRGAEQGLMPAQERVNEQLAPEYRSQISIQTLRDVLVGDFRGQLVLLFVASLAVLLIACSNVSHILLARGLARVQEIRIRAALGASRARLVQQLLVESVLLGALCVALALLLSVFGVRAAGAYIGGVVALDIATRIDPLVALFCASLGLVSVVLSGLWPARAAVRAGMLSRYAAPVRSWMSQSLVGLQVALTMLLLGVAGLMIRTVISETQIDPGFGVEGRWTAQLSLPAEYDSVERISAAFDEMLVRIAAIPGVQHAGVSSRIPLAGPTLGLDFARADAPDSSTQSRLRIASGDIPQAAGIRLLQGRWFEKSDTNGSRRVAVVNRAAAMQLWNTVDVLGQRVVAQNAAFQLADGSYPALEVVGVVEDARYAGRRSAAVPAVSIPLAQAVAGPLSWIDKTLSFVVAADRDVDSLSADVRAVVADFDRSLALFDIKSLNERLRLQGQVARLNSSLFSVLGLLSLLLAAAGLYGITATSVRQREQEMGIRLALGATLERIVLSIVRWSVVPVALGMFVGVGLLAVIPDAVREQFLGVPVFDPPSLVAALAVLITFVLGATLLPARRAAQQNPIESLRAD